MKTQENYDIVVIGAGHAGSEAAMAAACTGSKVIIISTDLTKIAFMSCNPAIGGIAKGQIIREIDALGGQTGKIADKTMIQFRMLNKSKGPAMWSPRAQCDRTEFSKEWRKVLESNKNIDLFQDMVTSLLIKEKTIKGVKTRNGLFFYSKCVILSSGTFLNGKIHIGNINITGGRNAEPASFGITEQLIEYGFETSRLKTGTSPRIDGRTIKYEELIIQRGDENPGKFSYENRKNRLRKQQPCYITHTSKECHNILKTGFSESPMFTGRIKGTGPRYCPSIEDKIVTFADKERHQLFIEPEGKNTVEMYLNGFTSSLPVNVQIDALRKIKGLENVKVFSPGYAIEYDFFQPTQLKHTLETKIINNLFFAGQINGTTGYEEAAAQGLIAGINAALKVWGGTEYVLKRDTAYIGVLIDDLVTKGVDEPYRMFTSRSEYRIMLRQDNADLRLTRDGYKLGLISQKRMKLLIDKYEKVEQLITYLKNKSVAPSDINELLLKKSTSKILQKQKLEGILKRPQVSIQDLMEELPELKKYAQPLKDLKNEIAESAEINIKYSGYIARERNIASKIKNLENIIIKEDFDFYKLASVSTEAKQKLTRIQPKTIGQASRIAGVSPADINVLLVHLGR